MLHGLKTQTNLNGELAIVLGPAQSSDGRVCVQLQCTSIGTLAVKQTNMKVVAASAATSGDGGPTAGCAASSGDGGPTAGRATSSGDGGPTAGRAASSGDGHDESHTTLAICHVCQEHQDDSFPQPPVVSPGHRAVWICQSCEILIKMVAEEEGMSFEQCATKILNTIQLATSLDATNPAIDLSPRSQQARTSAILMSLMAPAEDNEYDACPTLGLT